MTTALRHFFVSIDGSFRIDRRALFSARAWAPHSGEAIEMATSHMHGQGFVADGDWIIYDTLEPEEPAGDSPSIYGMKFLEYHGQTPVARR